MRMEELANNNFVKGTDSVERYLLDTIKNYFNSSGVANEDSKEYIIQKAVARMKEELYIDNAGVVSVNGETGPVTITLAGLGGEPKISPKLSSFNVNFGKEANTACEGNDSRLSDKRNPLVHTHIIDDINGLAGELSAIKNNVDLLSNKTHRHDNKSVLDRLTYTGSKTQIDVTILDTAEDMLVNKIAEVDANLAEIELAFGNYTTDINNTYTQYEEDYDNAILSIETKGDNVTAKVNAYSDAIIQTQIVETQASLLNKITKTQLNNIIQIANKGLQSIYEIDIPEFITTSDTVAVYEIPLPLNIINSLSSLDGLNYKVEFKIKYTDPFTSQENISTVPFLYTGDGKMQYSITTGLVNKSAIKIVSTRFTNSWSAFIINATISCRISTINNIPEVL